MALDFDKITLNAVSFPVRKDIMVYKGATLSVTFKVLDENEELIDISTYTANSKYQKHYTSSNSSPFTCSTNANGEVTLTLSANVTSNLEATRYVYDTKLTDANGVVYRILDGYLWVVNSITL